MAPDNLIQLGKNLNGTQKSIRHVTRRVAEKYPLLQRTRDEIARDFPFRQEFYIYTDSKHHVFVSILFFEEFNRGLKEGHSLINIPHTFTADDIGKWIPVGWAGDLNFQGNHNYSVIFSKTSTGSFDLSFKISFDSGEVDVTSKVITSTSEVFVPMNYSDLVNPPDEILQSVYILAKLNSLSGTLVFNTATYFMDVALYSPHKIEVL